jgi:hypothetical protein
MTQCQGKYLVPFLVLATVDRVCSYFKGLLPYEVLLSVIEWKSDLKISSCYTTDITDDNGWKVCIDEAAFIYTVLLMSLMELFKFFEIWILWLRLSRHSIIL